MQDHDAMTAELGQNAHTAVIYARHNGTIGFWNVGAENLFGHAASAVAGQRIDIIVPHELRAQHWAGFDRVIGSKWRGSEGWGPIEALHANGQRIALEVFLIAVQGVTPQVCGVMAFFRRA